jgi:hypothetical protein
MIGNMDWSIFWDAASAIGTVFVGLVAVGITIWQTHLQYHSKANINVCLSTLVGFQSDGTEIVEKPITATITNIGNSPMTITHVSICYKDKGKQEVSILNNPVNQTPMQRLTPKVELPHSLNGKEQFVYMHWRMEEIIEKLREVKLWVIVVDSCNRKFYSKNFTMESLKAQTAKLEFL